MILSLQKKTILLSVVISLILLGCGGGFRSKFKKGTIINIEGEIDNITRSELPYKDEMIVVTSVGFTDGQGISLIGIQPGLSKEKKIKISAEFFDNIRGTDIFQVVKIAPLSEN